MICPSCGKSASSVFRCMNCGDVRCTLCAGPSKKGGNAPGNYHQLACRLCRKQEVKKIG